MIFPTMCIHHVGADGSVELVAANVPYSSLQWTRRLSSCGDFQAELACELPVPWPGRYIVTLSGHDEIAFVEKCEGDDGAGASPPAISGRFGESAYDRYKMGPGGESCRGSSWRQAVTAALSAWHMGDLPPIRLGDGTQASSGSSYVLSGDAGKSAMDAIVSCASSNGARVVLSYDRSKDASSLEARIVDGLDRTRAQRDRPWWVFSISLGSSTSVSYSGDYSVACSEVIAHAEKDSDGETLSVTESVAVPGFDAETQWLQRAYEDVGSLIGQDEQPTPELVRNAGLIRAYDHMPSVAVDCDSASESYRSGWDVGDLVEVEMARLSLVAQERVEEAREIYDKDGPRVEASVGTKEISKVARAMMGRR